MIESRKADNASLASFLASQFKKTERNVDRRLMSFADFAARPTHRSKHARICAPLSESSSPGETSASFSDDDSELETHPSVSNLVSYCEVPLIYPFTTNRNGLGTCEKPSWKRTNLSRTLGDVPSANRKREAAH